MESREQQSQERNVYGWAACQETRYWTNRLKGCLWALIERVGVNS